MRAKVGSVTFAPQQPDRPSSQNKLGNSSHTLAQSTSSPTLVRATPKREKAFALLRVSTCAPRKRKEASFSPSLSLLLSFSRAEGKLRGGKQEGGRERGRERGRGEREGERERERENKLLKRAQTSRQARRGGEGKWEEK